MKMKIAPFFGILLFLFSCYPQGPDNYEEMDLVYTNYDDQFDFASQGTYSIPDKIVEITGNILEGEEPEFVKEPFATQMLQQMKDNMDNLGWEEVEDPINADVVLFPAVWTNTQWYYWYNYWCWYYPYYCGWWGWYYPPVISSITTGTLVMTMVVDGDEYIEPTRVWTSLGNGVVSGAYNTTRVTRAIDQAFEQSPYLNIE